LLIDTTDATEQMDGLMSVIEKLYSDDVNKQVKAMDQHANFWLKQCVWACSLVQAATNTMPAYKWWMQFGGCAPKLQHMAIRVLWQVSSACSCERNLRQPSTATQSLSGRRAAAAAARRTSSQQLRCTRAVD
jgi:hypothetical protein